MRFRLIPLASPELGVIEINDALFSVGRDRGAFKRLPAERAGRLSERHARLYDQNGALYAVDLSSRHGTFVNGRAVSAKPVELRHGDEINFGGELPFRVELWGGQTERAPPERCDIRLILEPVDAENGPDPLEVTSFPFVVSKQAAGFERHQDRAAKELDFLSRRHAQLYQEDGRILLQDLGSTNGTFVDGRALGDEAIVLQDGQTLAFGGEYFVYRVALQGAAETQPPADEGPCTQPQSSGYERTTFVTAGSSFLDMLCTEGAERAGERDPAGSAASNHVAEVVEQKRTIGWLGRLRQAVRRFDRPSLRRLQLLALPIVAVLGTVGYLLLRDSPTERMEALLADARVDEALEIARARVASLDGDSAFDRLALRALIAKTLPPWLDAYDAANYASMQAILDTGRGASPEQTATSAYIDTLSLIGDVERTMAERGGAAAPLRLFDEESAQVRAIVEAWNRPQPNKRKVTERLSAAIPPSDGGLIKRYRDAYQKAASNIRTLESQLSVYEPAAKQIEASIESHLASGSLDRLASELSRFANRYSQFAGLDALQDDLSKYRALFDASAEQRIVDAMRLARTTDFLTAPFAAAADRLIQEQLPPRASLDEYALALEAWRTGDVETAIERLESLSGSPASELARREIERIEDIVENVNGLQTITDSESYDERLLDLYHSLDGERDRYILTLLEVEYQDSRAAIDARAQQAAAEAARAWAEYKEGGRINSTLRLRSGIDELYRERATTLSEAGRATREARQLYETARVEIAPGLRSSLAAIENEIALQHQALDELVGVLQETNLQTKRTLLPSRLQ